MRAYVSTLVLLVTFILCVPAFAGPYSAVVVYGDSLSDNGNLLAATGFPAAPYFQGRRSNGPVAVEYLAAALGAPLVDFAWIGATTGIGNFSDGGTPTSFGAVSLPGMLTQYNLSAAQLPSLTDALFVVWGGPNDLLSPSPLDPTPTDIASRAIGDELIIIQNLQALGITHILAPGMPDLGLSPFFQSLGPAAAAGASAFTDAFNAGLQAALPSGVRYVDTATLLRAIVANPAAFGFTNATAPCFDGVTVCSNPDQYLFYDNFHPTTAGHALLAGQLLQAAVPEPSTLLLAACALGLLGAVRLRRPGRPELRGR